VREYLPKVNDIRQVSDAEVQAIRNRLNARPGKAFGYLTPSEVLFGAQSS